ncbi:MAG: glycosyltransferase [Calditrichaeota bacterium]|nr:MAG: glycosyltransferase [Calditrichota bacterium]
MKRVAIIVPGGMGEKDSPFTIPFLHEVLVRLSARYRITVYSISPLGESGGEVNTENMIIKAPLTRNNLPFPLLIKSMMDAIKRDHQKTPYHLIHGFWGLPSGLLAVLLGKRWSIPSLVTLLGGETAAIPEIGYGNLLTLRHRLLTLWVCRHASILILLTQFQRQALEQLGLQRPNLHIIPFGADERKFSFHTPPFQEPFHFLHVANLTEVKDQFTLLRAFALIRKRVQARLRIIGPDYLEGALHRLAQELEIGESVTFYGKLPHEELPTHYRWAHFLLHTSLHEGQAVVVSEAAASGTLVCGTRVGLIADLDEYAAISVERKDAEGLAQKVLAVIQSPERYNTLLMNGFNWAKKHNLQWTVNAYQSLYESAMNRMSK